MTTPLTPSAVKLPATVDIPSDAEPAGSTSLAFFVQPILNAVKWVTDIAKVFLEGGTLAAVANVILSTPSTFSVKVNSLLCTSEADGGDVFTAGCLMGMRRTLKADVNGTTVSVPFATQHVYSNNSSTAPTIWQLTAPSSGAVGRTWVVRFFTSQAPVVTIKDAGGTTIASIKRDAVNANHGVAVAYNGSSWDVIETMYYHG